MICYNSVLNLKVLVIGAFNQEKTLIGNFSVLVKLRTSFPALLCNAGVQSLIMACKYYYWGAGYQILILKLLHKLQLEKTVVLKLQTFAIISVLM